MKPTTPVSLTGRRDVVAVVAVDGVHGNTDAEQRMVASLRRCAPGITVLLAGGGSTVASVANRAWAERRCHLLVVGATVDLPDDPLGPALAILEGDQRTGTVSFLCDDIGFLQLPQPVPGRTLSLEHLDAAAVTSRLRTSSPDVAPSPIPYVAGPVVLLGAHAISAIGPLADIAGPDGLRQALVDFSLRGRRRGFLALVDPTTFVRRLDARPSPAPAAPVNEPESTLREEYDLPSSPLRTVHSAARAKVCGLRVLIDAARLGPREMGTQVATVALVEALARRDDVAEVCVALADTLPAYATSLLGDPKIDARVVEGRDFSLFGRVDVAHRPFQPDSPLDMIACRAVADRVVITILDLIAYHAVSYQLAPRDWSTYRAWLRRSMAQADAVVAPSHDVRRQILLERLPVGADRLVVAELGTDHLACDAPESAPSAVVDEGGRVGGFVVVLGADYTHKNRDLAVRAHQELCHRGLDLSLVLAGTGVHGSSRALEAEARTLGQRIVELPDISSEERNWLLRHASVVLYPTSGEGFGLVPFEAARLGTPTAFVPFGPLAELAGDLPVHAEDWSPACLADAVERFLSEPSVAEAQVQATLVAGDRYTWDATAEKLTAIYRSILAQPSQLSQAPEPEEVQAHLRAVTEEHERMRATNDRVQESAAYRLASRAVDVRDALRDRARQVCGNPRSRRD